MGGDALIAAAGNGMNAVEAANGAAAGARLAFVAGLRGVGEIAAARALDQVAPLIALLHDWRKRVKLPQSIRLLRDLARRPLAARELEADWLGDLPGDHHDIAVMRDRVAAEREAISEGAVVDRFLALTREPQAALSGAAYTMGARLFAEKPKALTGRPRCDWQARTGELQARGADAA